MCGGVRGGGKNGLIVVTDNSQKMAAYAKRNVENGLCAYCPRPALKGTTRCAYHTIIKKRNNAAWYRKNKELHKSKIIAIRKKRRQESRCIDCGMPLNPMFDVGVRCSICQDKNKRKRTYL